MTPRRLVFVAALGSALLLLGAFGFQLMGYVPCKLCLWQRWPHAAAIALGALFLARPMPVLAWLGALAAATSVAIGLYHTGVERRFFAGPDTCTANPVTGVTAEQLLDRILSAPLVRCDEVAWQFLTLSMASWNAILSLALGLIWAVAALRAAH